MSETIRWKELDDKEKTRLVLEHVMGYFVLEETAKGFHTPDLSKYAQSPEGFHWPIAFWNTDGECWVYRDIADNNVTFFDPLKDMNAAWQIVEKLRQHQRFASFEMMIDAAPHVPVVNFSFRGNANRIYHHSRGESNNVSEAICIAALRAACVEVDCE